MCTISSNSFLTSDKIMRDTSKGDYTKTCQFCVVSYTFLMNVCYLYVPDNYDLGSLLNIKHHLSICTAIANRMVPLRILFFNCR